MMSPRRQIGLILSAASSADSLGLIPGLEPILDTADYRLIIVTVPSDPVTARARVIRFLADGLTGILCCPTVYPAVLATVAEACPDPGSRVPVIVLWQGAGLAMLKAVGQPQVDAPVAHSGKAPGDSRANEPAVIKPISATPVIAAFAPKPPPVANATVPAPEPVVITPPPRFRCPLPPW